MDRTSKLVFAHIYCKATKLVAAGFLNALLKTIPFKIHTVLTDNGVQFVQLARGTKMTFPHIFGRACQKAGIEHQLTKPYHPRTSGQAERMVRTTKEATVTSFHYASIAELRRHVRDWLIAYNDCAGDCRRRHIQCSRCCCESALLGHGDEDGEALEAIHCCSKIK